MKENKRNRKGKRKRKQRKKKKKNFSLLFDMKETKTENLIKNKI